MYLIQDYGIEIKDNRISLPYNEYLEDAKGHSYDSE